MLPVISLLQVVDVVLNQLYGFIRADCPGIDVKVEIVSVAPFAMGVFVVIVCSCAVCFVNKPLCCFFIKTV